jgi:hypothetical protein
MKIQIKKPTYLLAMLMILSAFTVTGCSGSDSSDKNGEVSLDPSGICQEIIDAGVFADELSEVDNSYSDMIIGVSSDSFTSAVIYTGSGATAEELAIIQTEDSADAEYIIAKLNTHISNQADAYAGYKPEEVDKINSAIVKSNGSYIILCVAENNTAAEEIINKYFK